MSRKPKFELYSAAKCATARPELAPIDGKLVAIIGRSQDSNEDWSYTVYDSMDKFAPNFSCYESELVQLAPLPSNLDSECLENIVHQTANLRYSVRDEGLRQLLLERRCDPMKCLQISCDQGYDVHVTLVLPDGTVISADYRLHRETRQAVHFAAWEVETYSDREIELCREIVSKSDKSAFDVDVRRYFEGHLAEADSPLPPLPQNCM